MVSHNENQKAVVQELDTRLTLLRSVSGAAPFSRRRLGHGERGQLERKEVSMQYRFQNPIFFSAHSPHEFPPP
jgi:hypothetical protein